MPKRAALYARVSTKDKEQNPETQLLHLRDWANRQDLETIEYVDQASGKDLNRPGWKQLTDDWRSGKIDTVAVVRLDRAFRSVVDMHNCLAEWEGRGIRFSSITQPIDTGSSIGKFITTILGAAAELERDMIGERVKEGLQRAVSEGKKLGAPKIRLSGERAARVLDENNGDVEKTVEVLGVSKATFYRRLKKVG
ncbi:MAG: recombinase family protein [Chloroflexi bacterium]|nr:recombinase family protein [Chloroflexota bacterium]